MARVLLIDDDPDLSGFVSAALTESGHEVDCLEGAEGAPDVLSKSVYDVVLLDNRLPGLSGIEFLAALSERDLDVRVILMTGDPTSDTAIRATNLGAYGYVVKPLEFDCLVAELDPLIDEAARIARSMRERVRLPGDVIPACGPQMLGNSRVMQEVYRLIGKVAGTDYNVLILGETGTGKELVAQAIHGYSRRKNKPFVPMNCTALNESLLDDELFGHEAGAFTGADKLRKGRFEHANGGTLFLDEVGDMPLTLQAKLLRVLENREIVRIGGNDPIRVDVRIVSATHRDLEARVRDGQFREDLLYRLKFMAISVPPLRERGDDLRLLVDHFIRQTALNLDRSPPDVEEAAWRYLEQHWWNGNIRELRQVLGRAVLLCRGLKISQHDFDLAPAAGASCVESAGDDLVVHLRMAARAALAARPPNAYAMLLELLERELLALTLAECGGNRVQTARFLGVSRGWLLKKLREYELG